MFFTPHLSSVASQIQSREVVRVARTEVDDIHQVGRHVHHCTRQRGGGGGAEGGGLRNAAQPRARQTHNICLQTQTQAESKLRRSK